MQNPFLNLVIDWLKNSVYLTIIKLLLIEKAFCYKKNSIESNNESI